MAQPTVDRQHMVRAWRSLPPEQQQVLIEWYFRGASVATTAKALGVPSNTVRSRIYDALRYLARTT